MPVDAKKDTREVFQEDADELHATTKTDPAGPSTIVEQPDETKLKATVTQAAKDRTVTGNVGLLDSLDVRINPAKEDGNLSSIKTNTDNLNITQSSFRDAILGAATKDFSTIQTVLDSIKDTDGIKKITDAVTVIQAVAANLKATVTQAEKDRTVTNATYANLKGQVKITDETNFMPTMDVAARKGFVRHTDGTNLTPAMDAVGRAGFQKITDGTDVLAIDGSGRPTVVQAEKDRTVTNDTAANLKNEPAGNVAHDAVDSGNPVKTGGKAVNFDGTVPGTAVAENDRANFIADVYGRQFVETAHPNCWDESKDYAVAQTNTSIKASPGAGLRLCITDILISNGATAGNITLLNGSGGAVKWEIYPAINGGCVSNLKTPIKLTADTALCITSTTVTTHSVTICGYIAPG